MWDSAYFHVAFNYVLAYLEVVCLSTNKAYPMLTTIIMKNVVLVFYLYQWYQSWVPRKVKSEINGFQKFCMARPSTL